MFVSAAALGLAAVLTACGAGPTQLADELAVNMGDASPVASPPVADRAALPGAVIEFEAIRDLDTTEGLVGLRTESALHVGTLDEIEAGTAKTYELGAACGDVSANAGTFAIGCGDAIRLFTSSGEETIQTDVPVTAATVATTGEVLAGSDTERSVWLFRDGELAKTFSVARETDQIQAVPVAGQPDTVVRTNSFDTTIQDMDWQEGRQGGTLRVGLGVGKVAAGENGLILAADATGSQLLVYTSDDIIRLHQMAPVPESPWDAAWDSRDRLAWAASTAGNRASAYDISRGVPLERASLATVADPQSIAVLDDGTVLIASASGGGLQVISNVDKQLRDLPEA
nr:hypothetical protein [Corynebacterium stercoris]